MDLPVVAGAPRLDQHEAGRKPAELHFVRVRHDRHRVDAVGRQRRRATGWSPDRRASPARAAGWPGSAARRRCCSPPLSSMTPGVRRTAVWMPSPGASSWVSLLSTVSVVASESDVDTTVRATTSTCSVTANGRFEGQRDGRACRDRGGHLDRLKSVERRAERVPARRKVRYRELAVAVGDRLRQLCVSLAVDDYDDTRQPHRAVLRRHGSLDRAGLGGCVLGTEASRSARRDDQQQRRAADEDDRAEIDGLDKHLLSIARRRDATTMLTRCPYL